MVEHPDGATGLDVAEAIAPGAAMRRPTAGAPSPPSWTKAIRTPGEPTIHVRPDWGGGYTVQRWGEPRLTQDVDITLLTGFGGEESYVDALLASLAPRGNAGRP